MDSRDCFPHEFSHGKAAVGITQFSLHFIFCNPQTEDKFLETATIHVVGETFPDESPKRSSTFTFFCSPQEWSSEV